MHRLKQATCIATVDLPNDNNRRYLAVWNNMAVHPAATASHWGRPLTNADWLSSMRSVVAVVVVGSPLQARQPYRKV